MTSNSEEAKSIRDYMLTLTHRYNKDMDTNKLKINENKKCNATIYNSVLIAIHK